MSDSELEVCINVQVIIILFPTRIPYNLVVVRRYGNC